MSSKESDTFDLIRPKRSMSYNDLKKRRLIRSSKSKSRLQKFECDTISKTERKTPQTQCKSTITITTQHDNVIQSCINQVKHTLIQIKQQSKKKSIKHIIASKQFYTDRLQNSNPKNQLQKKINQKLSFYDKSDYVKEQKEVIKSIIMKKKSQRRLLRYSQIREQVKKSKSKSNQKSNHKKQKQDDETTISVKKDHNNNKNKKLTSSKSFKKIRANKFQIVPESNYATQRYTVKPTIQIQSSKEQKNMLFKNPSRRKLKKSISHIIIKNKIDNKQKSMINFDSLNINQEIIAVKQLQKNINQQEKPINIVVQQQFSQPKKYFSDIKQTFSDKKQDKQIENQSDIRIMDKIVIEIQNSINISGISNIQQKRNNSNFQSCLDLVEELQNNQREFLKTNEPDQENCSSISNILNLLGLPTSQLKIKLNQGKNTKRKHDLQKFKKVFPKNFFKN